MSRLVLTATAGQLGYVNHVYRPNEFVNDFEINVFSNTSGYVETSPRTFLLGNRVDMKGVIGSTVTIDPYTSINFNTTFKNRTVKVSFTITVRNNTFIGETTTVYAARKRNAEGVNTVFDYYDIAPIRLNLSGVGSSGSGTFILPLGATGCTLWVNAPLTTYPGGAGADRNPTTQYISFDEIVIEYA